MKWIILISLLCFAEAKESRDVNEKSRELCPDVTCSPENPNPPAWAEYHPHPYDCTKFCQCDWGVPIEMDCPEGLVWNQDANPGPVCDWQINVPRCNGEETTTESGSEEGSVEEGDGCETVKDCPALNPEPPAWAIYFEHPSDCGKFCQCDWGVAIEMDCPEGLVWNQDANPGPVCDWPRNVPRCNGEEPVSSSEETTTESGSEEGSVEEGDGCETVKDCPALNPEPPAWADYRKHPSDCSKFCQCNWGVAIEMSCPPGLVWNEDASPGPVCDWPRNVPRCN
ncbi:unnamed protein product [Cyprideis torosa]|uniref:Uncharacterized protein n=1 Tax=Cyprideis torosa TaxID=163714 RepID=A0A7R8WNY8_9CRUS|nr:unnamed protein product [Cyprideis torosa]CAG0906776.1 unnamed protein product [Cyprideis torosa]